MDFANKYKPKKIEDLICNKKQAIIIKNWLQGFDKNIAMLKKTKQDKTSLSNYGTIVVTGCHGIGKTSTISTIIDECGCKMKKLTNGIELEEINKNMFNVLSLLINKKSKEVKVIDELESISSPQEKNAIKNIIKKNDENRICPIIIISNNQHNKLLSEIKKTTYEIKFYKPQDWELKGLLSKISKNEHIKFQSMELIDTIIKDSQNDIRKLLFTLNDLKINSGDKTVNKRLYDEYLETRMVKHKDFNLFDSAEKLLYNYTDIDSCLSNFESQNVYLPLMVHQYYTDVINNNFKDQDTKYSLIKEISDCLSIGDVVENLIYGDQNWKAREIHGFYTCVNTSFSMFNNRYTGDNPKKIQVKFPQDLNKASIKKINKKNIDNVNKCIQNKGILDLIYICKIVKQLIKTNNLKECSQLLKPHNMKVEHIESLLKIEKIQYKNEIEKDKATKINLTSKQKKELDTLLKG